MIVVARPNAARWADGTASGPDSPPCYWIDDPSPSTTGR
jgi:hypothetical protein